MEKDKMIIVILVIAVIVLAAAMAVMFMPSLNAQKDSKIAITSDKTLNEGDNLTLKLTDLNKTPIKKAKVNVTITDKNGKVVVEKTLKTNSKGSAHMKLDLGKGKYTVNATFGGNENFTGNNTAKNITIKEVVSEEPATQQTSSSSSESSDQSSDELHYDPEVNVYYNSEGVIVDPDGQHSQGVGSSYADVRDARDRWERGEPVMV